VTDAVISAVVVPGELKTTGIAAVATVCSGVDWA
jgi:hypothetical protein